MGVNIVTIFSGKTDACLAHYAKGIQAGDGSFSHERRNEIEEFMRPSNSSAVLRWLKGDFLPEGENLVRIRYFLEAHDYEVAELVTLPPVVKSVGKAVALKQVALDDVALKLGTKRDLFLKVLRGTQGISAQREGLLRDILTSLNGAEPEVISEGAVSLNQCKKLVETKMQSDAVVHVNEVIVTALASLIQGAKPLADALVSDSCTPENRQKLRELVGAKAIFAFSNRLNALCSEMTREIIRTKERQS